MNKTSIWAGVSYFALLAALAAPAPSAWSAKRVLYSFKGKTDGASPVSHLTGLDTAGVLYGTASEGGGTGCGGAGCGVIFELIPPAAGRQEWTEEVIYRFAGGEDGAAPEKGLLISKTGELYGTTSEGGGGSCYSYHSVSKSTGDPFAGFHFYWSRATVSAAARYSS